MLNLIAHGDDGKADAERLGDVQQRYPLARQCSAAAVLSETLSVRVWSGENRENQELAGDRQQQDEHAGHDEVVGNQQRVRQILADVKDSFTAKKFTLRRCNWPS